MNRVTQILEFHVWIAYLIIPFVGMILVIRYIDLMVSQFKKKEQEG